MTRKNLSDAFGEINESLFALAENENKGLNELPTKTANNVQSPIFIKNIKENKAKNRRKAIISLTAGVAACAVLIVSLPVLLNNTAPPYGAADTTEAITRQPAPDETDSQTEMTQTETEPVTEEIPREPTEIELYTKVKEILNTEDVYNVKKTQFDLSGFEANGGDNNGALWNIYANVFEENTMLIDGSSFFYTRVGMQRFPEDPIDDSARRYGHIFLYDMETGEHTLILKEMAYKESNGLLLKPVYYEDGWLYYYYMEIRPTEDFYEYDGSELWRINIETKVKEKIAGLYEPFSGYNEPCVKSGKYLYFTDPVYAFGEGNSRILRYDMEEGQLDVFKEDMTGYGPYVYKHKDGIIYSIGDSHFYYHTDDGKSDKPLPSLSGYTRGSYSLEVIGNNGLIYRKEIDLDTEYPYPTIIGILDDEFDGRDLAAFPGMTFLNTNTGSDMKVILTESPITHNNEVFIYDREMDCFSQLKFPSEKDNAVYCTEQGDELRILVYSGEGNVCEGLTLYTITKK